MKVTYPISTKDGDNYLVMLESFEKSVLPDNLISMLADIDIMDVTLERVSGGHITNPSVLFEISSFIAGFLFDNENVILYFYCDDIHEISRRNHDITPQKYRSHLFSRMFDRYITTHHITEVVNTSLEIKSDRDIYIHIISRRSHLDYANVIRTTIKDMESK